MEEQIVVNLEGEGINFMIFSDIAKVLKTKFNWMGNPVSADLSQEAMDGLISIIKNTSHIIIPNKSDISFQYDFNAPIDCHKTNFGDIKFSVNQGLDKGVLAIIYGQGFPDFVIVQ